MNRIICFQTDINVTKFAKQVLKNESKIIKRYPPKGLDGVYSDGDTGLGYNSLTSRFAHFNILNWWGTGSLRKWIRRGYENFNNIKGQPLYVQCWANVMRKGEQILPHRHSIRDGVSPIKYLCGHLSVQVDGSTSTYYQGRPVLNKLGEMAFFPADVYHWTDRYEKDSERITIAFDIYSKEVYSDCILDEFKYHWVKI